MTKSEEVSLLPWREKNKIKKYGERRKEKYGKKRNGIKFNKHSFIAQPR